MTHSHTREIHVSCTFSHDNYLVQKQQKQQRKSHSDNNQQDKVDSARNVIDDTTRHPLVVPQAVFLNHHNHDKRLLLVLIVWSILGCRRRYNGESAVVLGRLQHSQERRLQVNEHHRPAIGVAAALFIVLPVPRHP